MTNYGQFYIDGEWIAPLSGDVLDVINPATEEPCAQISLGNAADVDRAVRAARRSFEAYSQTTAAERTDLLKSIIGVYGRRLNDVGDVISQEMGAPITMARTRQAPAGISHFETQIKVLGSYVFEKRRGTTMVVREPIGVAGLITPWNWPINMVSCKVAAALAAGCTIVLKPSEVSPLNAHIFAEILHEAGVPKGVFNLVDGTGPVVGAAMSSHPDIDVISFTGSTRAGIDVAKRAADTVKRVTQELGGKSANIVLADADLQATINGSVGYMMMNSGQSCNAPSRMLVPRHLQAKIADMSRELVESIKVGDPRDPATTMGPVANQAQYEKIQLLVGKGIDEGAKLICGGLGRPAGINQGFFARPTIFADVTNEMTIAREEIFGPVLCILPYDTEEDAIRIANDTNYGLAGYIQAGDHMRAREIASRLRAGSVHINQAPIDPMSPFGGYKQSGNGREYADYGLEEYLETKSILGAVA